MLYNWLNLTQMEWLFSWVGLGVLEMRIKTKITASHTLNEKTNKQTNKQKENKYESDLHSNEHYLRSSENKAGKKIQACTGFESMTSAIPVQCSTNWANKVLFSPLLK